GKLLSVIVPVTDPVPGRALVFSLVSPPPGASIDPSSGRFTWTPSSSQAGFSGTIVVQVAVAGNSSPSSSRGFQVTVLVPPQLGPVTLEALRKGRVNKGTIALHLNFNEALDPGAGATARYVLTTQQKARGRKKGTISVPVAFTATRDPATTSVT